MGIVAVVVLAGVALFAFIKWNAANGAKAVQAYLYLRAIGAGSSIEDANQTANVDVLSLPTQIIRDGREFVRFAFGGSQLKLIAEAERQGFVLSRPEVSSRQGVSRGSEPKPTNDWVQPFILYYVASEMQYSQGLPDTVRALATGQTTDAAQQSILVALQRYLSFAYGRDRRPDDWSQAMQAGQIFVRAELDTLNTPIALRRFIRRMHKRDTDVDISPEVLEAQYVDCVSSIKADKQFAMSLRIAMLRESVEELFASAHGMTIHTFDKKLAAVDAR